MKHDSTGERGSSSSSSSSSSTEKILFLTDHNRCAVGIFGVKASCITSVGGIKV